MGQVEEQIQIKERKPIECKKCYLCKLISPNTCIYRSNIICYACVDIIIYNFVDNYVEN